MNWACVLLLFLALPARAFDHEHRGFGRVLSSFVKTIGAQTLVDYRALKQESSGLEGYLRELSALSRPQFESFSRDEQLALLINAYNAWTLKLVIDHYPVKSIKDIGPFYSSPWKLEFLPWLGQTISLDELEHERIRKVFKEPRIHFALVCASIGCPVLRPVPYVARALEAQLAGAQTDFLRDTSKNRFAVEKDRLKISVSSIFKWYGSDFGDAKALEALLVREMGIAAAGKRIALEYLDYDWSLNEAK